MVCNGVMVVHVLHFMFHENIIILDTIPPPASVTPLTTTCPADTCHVSDIKSEKYEILSRSVTQDLCGHYPRRDEKWDFLLKNANKSIFLPETKLVKHHQSFHISKFQLSMSNIFQVMAL